MPHTFINLVAQNPNQDKQYTKSAFRMVYSDLQAKEPAPLGVVSFHLLCKYLLNTLILHDNRLLLREFTS